MSEIVTSFLYLGWRFVSEVGVWIMTVQAFGGEKSVDNVLLTFFISCFVFMSEAHHRKGALSFYRQSWQWWCQLHRSSWLQLEQGLSPVGAVQAWEPKSRFLVLRVVLPSCGEAEAAGSLGLAGQQSCQIAGLQAQWESLFLKRAGVWIKGMNKIRRMKDKKEEGRGEKGNVLNTLYVLVCMYTCATYTVD